jgi:NAD(P)-dependent dehydrogenase (short-subunit alcohol dehydrogenase family)
MFEQADAASQQSLRDLAARVAARYERLDILVNNVAGLYAERELTVDGIEATLAVTHLAWYLLTRLLLPALGRADAARVVNVTSGTYRAAKLDFADLQAQDGYRGFDQYQRAKLMMVLCSRELARRAPAIQVLVADPVRRRHGVVRALDGARDDGSGNAALEPGVRAGLAGQIGQHGSRGEIPGSRSDGPRARGTHGLIRHGEEGRRVLKVARDQNRMRETWNASATLTGLPEEVQHGDA